MVTKTKTDKSKVTTIKPIIKKGFCPVREYTYDIDKEVNGVWFNIDETAKVKVARFGTTHYLEAYARIYAELNPNPQDQSRELQDELSKKAVLGAFAEVILLDWENFVNLDGTELKYSKAAALELLSLDDFFELIANFSRLTAQYQKYRVDDAVKN